MGQGLCFQWPHSRVLIYKKLKLLGAQNICTYKDTICVWGWRKEELVEGELWLGLLCWYKLVQRGLPALGQMLPVAGSSSGLYTTQKARPGGVDSVGISFLLSVLSGLTLFTAVSECQCLRYAQTSEFARGFHTRYLLRITTILRIN